METLDSTTHPQSGLIRAKIEELIAICEFDPVTATQVELAAIDEAQERAKQLRDELKAAGVKPIEIASQLRKGKPR